jgi:hypothetical protein
MSDDFRDNVLGDLVTLRRLFDIEGEEFDLLRVA